ncbi:MAG: recombination mediator RecR [Bacteroidales bacterium]|nr:recombination mediator RecR [Bacteroidales bacterium]
MQEFSSKLLENTVTQLSKLPGIGKRTATRLALYLLQKPTEEVDILTDAISHMRHDIFFCKNCHNISDQEECEICRNNARNKSQLCVVQDIRDVIAIENTHVHKGVYHILGGIISPMNGIGPGDLHMESLFEKVKKGMISEIIIALPTTTEGDTTAYYIYKHITEENLPVKITTIARGLSVGDELEYADELTLGRSLVNRIDFELSIMKK